MDIRTVRARVFGAKASPGTMCTAPDSRGPGGPEAEGGAACRALLVTVRSAEPLAGRWGRARRRLQRASPQFRESGRSSSSSQSRPGSCCQAFRRWRRRWHPGWGRTGERFPIGGCVSIEVSLLPCACCDSMCLCRSGRQVGSQACEIGYRLHCSKLAWRALERGHEGAFPRVRVMDEPLANEVLKGLQAGMGHLEPAHGTAALHGHKARPVGKLGAKSLRAPRGLLTPGQVHPLVEESGIQSCDCLFWSHLPGTHCRALRMGVCLGRTDGFGLSYRSGGRSPRCSRTWRHGRRRAPSCCRRCSVAGECCSPFGLCSHSLELTFHAPLSCSGVVRFSGPILI